MLNRYSRLSGKQVKQFVPVMHGISDIVLFVQHMKEVLQFERQHFVRGGKGSGNDDSDLMVFPVHPARKDRKRKLCFSGRYRGKLKQKSRTICIAAERLSLQ